METIVAFAEEDGPDFLADAMAVIAAYDKLPSNVGAGPQSTARRLMRCLYRRDGAPARHHRFHQRIC